MNNIYILLALLISFLWGIQPIIFKHLLSNISPITLMILNGSINLLCLGLLYLYYSNEINKDIKKLIIKDYILIIFSVITTVFLTNLIFYSILQKNETSIITALVYSAPFFTLIIAYLILKERINNYGILGILLIILGVIFIAFNNKFIQKEKFFLLEKE
jgi:drug/metabolite transporter (DMT)-like permease